MRVDELRSLSASPNAPNVWTPLVDVYEEGDAVLVRLEVPGMTLDHVRIKLLDNVLKIEGRKERATPTGKLLPEEERPVRFLCLERGYGNFTLTLTIKWPIDPESVIARLTDGVLEIRLPKTKTCGREITISITE